jgi:mannose/fructose-specific phosphotransferase system component IIA
MGINTRLEKAVVQTAADPAAQTAAALTDNSGGTPSQTLALINANAVTLTDSSGGTPATTVAAISDPPTQAEVRNALASILVQLNRLTADQAAVKNAVASLADEVNKETVDVGVIRTKLIAGIADLSSLYDVVNAGE